MTQHVRKLSILPRSSGFRAGVARGLAASDWAFDSNLAVPRCRDLQAGSRYDLQALRGDFQNAERRFVREYPGGDSEYRKAK